MALDTTPNGTDSNSYVTIAEADEYFNGHYSLAKATAWSELGDAQKESALKAAANEIETLAFEGCRYYWNQRLFFPRAQDWVHNYQIPQEVKDAQCEQAIFMLSIDDSALAAQYQGIQSESIGAGSVRTSTTYNGNGSLVAPMAYEFLRHFVRRGNRLHRA